MPTLCNILKLGYRFVLSWFYQVGLSITFQLMLKQFTPDAITTRRLPHRTNQLNREVGRGRL